ncbi:MAG: hypothetical protein AAF442_08115 [Pseudomonadota bacterium]
MINKLENYWRRRRSSSNSVQELRRSFVRCFDHEDGHKVLEHLWRMTLDQATGPHISDAHLRHLEGQRYILKYILNHLTPSS